MFAADHLPAGVAHMAIIRSPFPHARIGNINLSGVRTRAGVNGAWSGAELGELGTLPGFPLDELQLRQRPVVATGESRYVGEPLGIVVAEHRYVAADAAFAAELDLEPLPATAAAELGEQAGHLDQRIDTSRA